MAKQMAVLPLEQLNKMERTITDLKAKPQEVSSSDTLVDTVQSNSTASDVRPESRAVDGQVSLDTEIKTILDDASLSEYEKIRKYTSAMETYLKHKQSKKKDNISSDPKLPMETPTAPVQSDGTAGAEPSKNVPQSAPSDNGKLTSDMDTHDINDKSPSKSTNSIQPTSDQIVSNGSEVARKLMFNNWIKW
jgi:hypothetical protein